MKKTTKILLVLAAVVAMTIGAVSTVMAADEFPTIGKWTEVKDKGWTAVDTNGEEIVRGWAVEDGYWYFFDSSYMLVNTFITWNEEIYYLDGAGHMAIGWIGFDADKKTAYETEINTVDKHEKRKYANVSLIEGFNDVFDEADVDAVGKPLFTQFLAKGKTYEVAWCYFDTDGTMAQNEWIQTPDGLWYFIYGAYCVMGDYQVAIDLGDLGADDEWLVEAGEGFYGFAPDGHAYFDWTEIVVNSGELKEGDKTDNDTPYQDKEDDDDTRKSTTYWTYYHTNGRQVNTTSADPKDPVKVENGTATSEDIYEGWENINGQWCYFIAHDEYGMVLLQNDFIYDANTDADGKLNYNDREGTFYVDANGYLVKGVESFAKGDKIGTWEEKTANAAAVAGELKFALSNAIFKFSTESGEMLYGIQDNYYYLTKDGDDEYIYEVIQSGADMNVTTQGAINLDLVEYTKIYKGETKADTAEYVEGQRLTGKNFFVVIDEEELDIKWNADDDKEDTFIYYFESGRMQKNQAIKFGSVTIAIDANGCVVTAATDNKVNVAGHDFVLDPGNADNCIKLGAVYTIPGLKK